MVRTVIAELRNRKFTNIKANLEKMTLPEQISGFLPDFTFSKGDAHETFVIFEVETCSSLTSADTAKKWKAFFEKARVSGGEFHLAVPKMCGNTSGRALTDQQFEKLQIKADLVWTVNGSLQHRVMKHQGQRG